MAFILLLALTPLAVQAHGPAVIVTPPVFSDASGNELESVVVGSQVVISTTFKNNVEEPLPFVWLLEVRDSDGVTLFLAWQSGFLDLQDNRTMAASYLVQEPSDYYQARVFVLSNILNPQVLSQVLVSEVRRVDT